VQARCGSPSKAAPRTGDDGNAPAKSAFSIGECFTVPELRDVHERAIKDM
jgi:hypothetical protein